MADDVMACSDIQAATGGATALQMMGMSCWYGNASNWQQTARSMHPDGVNSCFADGSVHWLSDYIEVSTSMSYTSVWDRLMLSDDGLMISADAY